MLYSSLPTHQAVVSITQLKGKWHLCQRTLQVSFYPLILLEITYMPQIRLLIQSLKLRTLKLPGKSLWKSSLSQLLMYVSMSCCKQWRTNYLEFFPQRLFPAPAPIATSENGLQIDRAKGKFQSLFQSLFLASSLKLDVCYDEYCPSLQEKKY